MATAERLDDLPSRLREHRRQHGLSQAQLAARLETTPQTIGRWEAGSPPQVRWRGKIEAELNPVPPVMLRSIAGGVEDVGADRPLTRLQERAIEVFLARAERAAPMSDDEVAGFRTVFSQVGLGWLD